MEIIRRDEVVVLVNPGVVSHQLLSPMNSASSRLTITRVVLQPGATNARHRHETSEQVWIALSGSGILLLADDATLPFAEGTVVRFVEGEIHGLHNAGPEPFEYFSVTAPPIDFREAYATQDRPPH
jgi:mannose-6-phosphate isomerase-like protein (cupin superfamily)